MCIQCPNLIKKVFCSRYKIRLMEPLVGPKLFDYLSQLLYFSQHEFYTLIYDKSVSVFLFIFLPPGYVIVPVVGPTEHCGHHFESWHMYCF